MLCVLLLSTILSASAHICLTSPPQRGGANITGPGSRSCFNNKIPCGGKLPGPAVNLQGGVSNAIFFQQNLNHYSIGNRGWIDIGLSDKPNPQSDDDFEVLETFPDYNAYHQWTQTNFSVDVVLPDIDCPACVLRIRYHPNKPTEPLNFLQCADVIINRVSTDSPRTLLRPQHGPLVKDAKPILVFPHPEGSEFTLSSLIGLLSDQNTGTTFMYNSDPVSGTTQIVATLDAPVQTTSTNSSLAGFSRASDASSHLAGAHLAEAVVTVDRTAGYVWLLKANNFTQFPNLLLAVDPRSGGIVFESLITGLPSALNGIYFDDTTGVILGFGINNVDSSYFHVRIAVSFATGLASVVKFTSFANSSPYVDFAWGVLDSAAKTLYVLLRHEDEPTSLAAQIVVFSAYDGAYPAMAVYDLPPAPVFSSMWLDYSGRGALLAFSPGTVDPSTGDVPTPQWQVVSISLVTSPAKVAPVAFAPSNANAFSVFWGGSVAGGAASDVLSYHFVSGSSQPYPYDPRPTNFLGLAYNIKTNIVTVLPVAPVYTNMCVVV
jgi:hypothetical protein